LAIKLRKAAALRGQFESTLGVANKLYNGLVFGFSGGIMGAVLAILKVAAGDGCAWLVFETSEQCSTVVLLPAGSME
jgi:hypothetical protein